MSNEQKKKDTITRSEYEEYLRLKAEKKPSIVELVPELSKKPKDALDLQMEADFKKESEQAQLSAQGRHEKEEIEAKQRLQEQEDKKNIERYNAEFLGELPEHKILRKAILEARTPEEQRKLREEYHNLHYQVPTRVLTFKKIITFECESEGVKLVKVGNEWKIRGIDEHSLDRFKETPKVTTDSQTGLPSLYTFLITNMGLYQLKKSGQYVDLHIELED